jgi:hypothetical protein
MEPANHKKICGVLGGKTKMTFKKTVQINSSIDLNEMQGTYLSSAQK